MKKVIIFVIFCILFYSALGIIPDITGTYEGKWTSVMWTTSGDMKVVIQNQENNVVEGYFMILEGECAGVRINFIGNVDEDGSFRLDGSYNNCIPGTMQITGSVIDTTHLKGLYSVFDDGKKTDFGKFDIFLGEKLSGSNGSSITGYVAKPSKIPENITPQEGVYYIASGEPGHLHLWRKGDKLTSFPIICEKNKCKVLKNGHRHLIDLKNMLAVDSETGHTHTLILAKAEDLPELKKIINEAYPSSVSDKEWIYMIIAIVLLSSAIYLYRKK